MIRAPVPSLLGSVGCLLARSVFLSLGRVLRHKGSALTWRPGSQFSDISFLHVHSSYPENITWWETRCQSKRSWKQVPRVSHQPDVKCDNKVNKLVDGHRSRPENTVWWKTRRQSKIPGKQVPRVSHVTMRWRDTDLWHLPSAKEKTLNSSTRRPPERCVTRNCASPWYVGYEVWQKSKETYFWFTKVFIYFKHQCYLLQNSSLGQLHTDRDVFPAFGSSAGNLQPVWSSACLLHSFGCFLKSWNDIIWGHF